MTHVGILLLLLLLVWVHRPGAAKKHAYTLKLFLCLAPMRLVERGIQQIGELIEVHCASGGGAAALNNGDRIVSEFRLTGYVAPMRTRNKLNYIVNWYSVSEKGGGAVRVRLRERWSDATRGPRRRRLS